MNEIKRARQQLDARNGIQPARTQKAVKKRPKKKKGRPENTSAHRTSKQRPSQISDINTERLPQSRRYSEHARQSSALDERRYAKQTVTKKRRKKRKKNYILYYITLFVFILVAGIILSLTVFFNIDSIEVEGTSKYSVEEIITRSGLQTGDNLFRISTGAASEKIITGLEYIDKVEIKKSFPNKLIIVVTEAKPVMSLWGETGYYLVSNAGRILESGLQEPKEGTSIVTGIDLAGYKNGDFIEDSTSDEMETLRTIYSVCNEMNLTGLTRIDLNSIVDIRIYVDDRIRIDIGSITDLTYKLTFAHELIDGQIGKDEKGVIDVKQGATAYYRPAKDLSDASYESLSDISADDSSQNQ